MKRSRIGGNFFFSFVLVFALCDFLVNCSTTGLSENGTVAPEIKIRSPAEKWLAADKTLKKMSASMVKNILPHAMRASETLNLTSDCSRGLMKFLIGIKQTKLWAYQSKFFCICIFIFSKKNPIECRSYLMPKLPLYCRVNELFFVFLK